jgi:hypothetical protein
MTKTIIRLSVTLLLLAISASTPSFAGGGWPPACYPGEQCITR